MLVIRNVFVPGFKIDEFIQIKDFKELSKSFLQLFYKIFIIKLQPKISQNFTSKLLWISCIWGSLSNFLCSILILI